jgi:hypothetical protein
MCGTSVRPGERFPKRGVIAVETLDCGNAPLDELAVLREQVSLLHPCKHLILTPPRKLQVSLQPPILA